MSSASSLRVPLEQIPSCFEGMVPSPVCSCSADGVPNVTYLSIVLRLDSHHVGLSNQFLNKTWTNVQENPHVQIVVVSPETSEQFRLDLLYERTESEGATFERMNTRLQAVASQTGMSQVFHLRGVDIYRVFDCRRLSAQSPLGRPEHQDYLSALDSLTEVLALAPDLDLLTRHLLAALSRLFGYHHSFLMVLAEDQRHLFTIASYGFEGSGIGSEVQLGVGLLGIAAERRIVMRNPTVSRDFVFAKAVRAGIEARGEERLLETKIALPGLTKLASQMVIPLLAQDEFLGLLCLQSPVAGRFIESDERLMRIIARQIAALMILLRSAPVDTELTTFQNESHTDAVAQSVVKHYAADDSVFIDDAYVIKGLAGRILWKLLQIHANTGRTAFSNKEIRLDASLKMPDIKDNLEARLILLRRRLQERGPLVGLIPTGRGQFRLEVQRTLTLFECPADQT